MSQRARMGILIAANGVCLVVAAAVVFYAVRDWPARYADGTLSWSVTGFFVAFVALSIAGSVATAMYARAGSRMLLRLSAAPAALAAAGFVLGLLKAATTGDF